jgi:hypothetical protein
LALSESAPRGLIVPEFKKFANLSGGLNLLQPPDAIGDLESSDLQNLIYLNGVLQVDTGYYQVGTRTVGNPLQPIQFELRNGSLITCLITTTAFYTFNNATSDWVIAMNPILSTTTTQPLSSSPFSSDFSSAFGPISLADVQIPCASVAGVVVGDIVQVARNDTAGTFFTSTVTSIVGNTVICADPFLSTGQTSANGAAVNFFTPFNGGAYSISWTIDPTTNTLIWTNGVDQVQAFSGTGYTAPLAGLSAIASTARLVTRFYGFTLAIGTTESGTQYPYRVRRSTNVSSVDWTSTIAGYDDLIDTPDAIISETILGPYIILGRENSIMVGSYWGTATQSFFWQYTITGLGVLEGGSITKSTSNAVMVTASGVYYYQGSYALQDIGEKVFNYFLGPQGNLSPANQENLFSIYIAEIDEIWIFYPDINATYGNNLLRYSNKYGGWFPQKLPSQFAGVGLVYNSNSISWIQDTLTWAQKTTAWNSRAATGNYPNLLLASPSDRLTYIYDFKTQNRNGAMISWYFVTKDFPVLENKLLFDGIVAYGKGNNVSVAISVDGGNSYQTVGVMNFGDSYYTKQILDYQVAGDFFRIRFSGVGYGFFLSQFALRYLSESEY